MIINNKFKILFLLILFLYSPSLSLAYDEVVHSSLNRSALLNSKLDVVLKTKLKISDGISSELRKGDKIRKVFEWIAYGGEEEDSNLSFDPLATRAYNHFHDPLLEWNDAGFDSELNSFYFARYQRFPVSMILWALNPGEQDFTMNRTGDWSWRKAREYYFSYLTGRDFLGNEVAGTDLERNECLANCLRSVGQVMHLLQDASVPLHTRNDAHPNPLEDNYEKYTKKEVKNLSYTPIMPGPELLEDPRPDSNYALLLPVSGLFDRNLYNAGDPMPPANAAIGLAEYTNANFLTEDTVWLYANPINATNYDESVWLNPEAVDADDGITDYRIYFKKTEGETVDHLVAASYWYYQLYMWNSPVLKYAFLLDETCYAEYASKLIPRAVGYSAELLDYFFRGKLQVASIPVFRHNGLYAFLLNIKNLSERQEMMSDGRFSLLVRYMPPDGSGEKWVQAHDVDVAQLNYDEGQMFQFFLPQLIPLESVDTVECVLAYRGKLGNEVDAVIGKVFSPGKTKFIEEWDKGLTGNHSWYHTPSDYNVDNGITKNTIENGALIKENVRYAGDDRSRINESFIYFTELGSPYQHLDSNSPDGILITPNTFVQFRIDDLSINENPPAPEGYTNAYQYLQFEFNAFANGNVVPDFLTLQFTQEGQGIDFPYSREASYSFQFGSINICNVYNRLINKGFTIPEPFYLQVIHLNQFLNFLEEPSTTEHRQRMEVDFISIVEGNSE